jgi:hypothetical protein
MSAALHRVNQATALFVVCVLCSSCGDPHVAHLLIGRGRAINIWAEASWEINRGIYYEVRDGDRVVTRKTFFEADDGKARHTYTVVFAERHQLVGVVEDGRLIIIQDFQAGESWPRLRDDEISYSPDVVAKWRAVFKRLRAENADLRVPYFENDSSNKAASGNGAVVLLFEVARRGRAVPEPIRSAK